MTPRKRDRDTLGSRLRSAIDGLPPEGKSRGIGLLISKLDGAPGANYPSINSYLDDQVNPPLAFIEAAASALGVRKQWLAFGGKEPRTEEALRQQQMSAEQPPEVRRFFQALEDNSPIYQQADFYPDIRQAMGVLAWRIGTPFLEDGETQRNVVDVLDHFLTLSFEVFCPFDNQPISPSYLRAILIAAHEAVDVAEVRAREDERDEIEVKKEIMERLLLLVRQEGDDAEA